MINERIAPILLNGEILSSVGPDPELYQALLQMLQNFCGCLFSHVRKWQIQKNWRYLKVALKLFKEGNETVKNGIVTIYLFSISNALCGKKELS